MEENEAGKLGLPSFCFRSFRLNTMRPLAIAVGFPPIFKQLGGPRQFCRWVAQASLVDKTLAYKKESEILDRKARTTSM